MSHWLRRHRVDLALAVLFLVGTLGMKSLSRPVSRWNVVACWLSPDRAHVYYECQFSGEKSTGAIAYRVWHWGVNFAPDDTTMTTDSVVRHIFVPGRYVVRQYVYDTLGLRSYRTDTVTVPTNLIPLPVDTLAIHDTVTLAVHDTAWIFPPSLEIRDPNGAKDVYLGGVYLGRYMQNPDNSIGVYRYLGPVYSGMPLWQTHPTLTQAIRALLNQ